MEKNQFTFKGLSWMTPEQIQAACSTLEKLKPFGITYDFRRGTQGMRLVVYGFDDIIKDDYDDTAVIFYKKALRVAGGDMSEDVLALLSIDDDMNVAYKLVDSRFIIDSLNIK